MARFKHRVGARVRATVMLTHDPNRRVHPGTAGRIKARRFLENDPNPQYLVAFPGVGTRSVGESEIEAA